jgi:hypothetical protein
MSFMLHAGCMDADVLCKVVTCKDLRRRKLDMSGDGLCLDMLYILAESLQLGVCSNWRASAKSAAVDGTKRTCRGS